SPDGQLRYIPLAALHDGDRWLIERYQINNITAESLTDLTATNTTEPRILAAAYTDVDLTHTPEVNGKTYRFQGLPGAGLEVETLPTETKLLNEAFSLEAVRPIMDEYSVLHFATHAAFVPGVPEDSFILFGNGDTASLRDIENWTLNGVDLVVLSACETGVGGLGNGEEVLGLGYQFQASGAKAVIASLWQVSDQGTALLMETFYDALAQGMTKAEALQTAQLALINLQSAAANDTDRAIGVVPIAEANIESVRSTNYSHPYYWAPFILIGNGL
ncbi:MAG: CHAT domain-containing protein, partial [Cyanobacteria bacterium P01_H01_bin.152]